LNGAGGRPGDRAAGAGDAEGSDAERKGGWGGVGGGGGAGYGESVVGSREVSDAWVSDFLDSDAGMRLRIYRCAVYVRVVGVTRHAATDIRIYRHAATDIQVSGLRQRVLRGMRLRIYGYTGMRLRIYR
jgi:hypothetical protein